MADNPNTLFSTDILFITTALGEGPVYRINPNGSIDIEMNEGTIDSMLDGVEEDNEFIYTNTRNGTINQSVMPVFGEEVVVPQTFSSRPVLKYGNIEGVPRVAVEYQNTSAGRWDVLRFHFGIQSLQEINSKGKGKPYELGLKVIVYNRVADTVIATKEITIEGKTNVGYATVVDVVIPEEYRTTDGYQFSIEKTSEDSDDTKIQDTVAVLGWDEITNDDFAYPRTAIIGYALKAHAEVKGQIPTLTSMVKGLLCKVPSNYNQPVLGNGEIDWRELEVVESDSDEYGYGTRGYRLQRDPATIKTELNPVIYDGLWDGTFVTSWTQNPVWILYDLLTSTTYGLGIPESRIEKFKFYKAAQYCDAVDMHTGRWEGVDAIADGTYFHRPRNHPDWSDTGDTPSKLLIGIPSGTAIKERRFVCDITISAQKQVVDIINQVAAIFRGILFYSAGKITLNIDLPDELPVAIFNEGNIIKDTLTISGIKESEILTGVEVSFVDPTNHYKRDIVRIDDPIALNELNQIENIARVDLSGVTRRSQAVRFAQYLLASSRYIRRNASFKTSIEAVNLTIGDIIAISQRATGTAWGYGGRVFSNASQGSSNVVLEHFTSPAITSSVFESNTNPLALRIINQLSDRVDLYLVSNSVSTTSSSNTIDGIDLAELEVIKRFKPDTKTFSSANSDIQFSNLNTPVRGDLWTLGEVNPNNYLSSLGDKLFKVTGIVKEEDGAISITSSEYIANVYIDSDTIIEYTPAKYKDEISPLATPPAPNLNIARQSIRKPDGSIGYNITVSAFTDTSGYPIPIETQFENLVPSVARRIESIG